MGRYEMAVFGVETGPPVIFMNEDDVPHQPNCIQLSRSTRAIPRR
jgi:hypothetical protein